MSQPEVLIPLTLFICIAASIKFIVDARTRRRLVETNPSEELVKAMLLADEQARRSHALKWGLVLTMLGLCFGLIDLLNLSADDPATFGLLVGGAGVAMLGFHLIVRRNG